MKKNSSRRTASAMLAVAALALAPSSFAATGYAEEPSLLPGQPSAMASTPAAAARGPRSVHWDLSGSFMKVAIDLNADGLQGNLLALGTRGTFDDADMTGYVEGVPVAPTGACPADQVEFGLHEGKTVQRFGNGDLLKLYFTGGTACLSLATFDASVTYDADIGGGTGRFAGATGNVTLTAILAPMVIRPGEIAFGTAVGEVDGNIVLPLRLASP